VFAWHALFALHSIDEHSTALRRDASTAQLTGSSFCAPSWSRGVRQSVWWASQRACATWLKHGKALLWCTRQTAHERAKRAATPSQLAKSGVDNKATNRSGVDIKATNRRALAGSARPKIRAKRDLRRPRATVRLRASVTRLDGASRQS